MRGRTKLWRPAEVPRVRSTGFIASLASASARDRLTAEGPPGLTKLAAKVALMEAALVTLADTSPNRDALAATGRRGGRA